MGHSVLCRLPCRRLEKKCWKTKELTLTKNMSKVLDEDAVSIVENKSLAYAPTYWYESHHSQLNLWIAMPPAFYK